MWHLIRFLLLLLLFKKSIFQSWEVNGLSHYCFPDRMNQIPCLGSKCVVSLSCEISLRNSGSEIPGLSRSTGEQANIICWDFIGLIKQAKNE